MLHGRARLRYTNRSPATLDTLWLHQHLNAFRPNSAWARRELEFGERRFQDLGPARATAFERFTAVSVGGAPGPPRLPGRARLHGGGAPAARAAAPRGRR